MPPILMRSPEDWELIVAEVHKRSSGQPIWKCLAGYYNVCIPSILDAESLVLWNMYIRSGRGQNETWQSYLDMPALVADAFELFDQELHLFMKDKERKDQQQFAREIAKAKTGKYHGRH